MEQDIETLSRKLMEAVEVVMNVEADKQQRLEANEVCENFKESSPYCVQCGLFLASKHNSPVIRNFGLQLIEHCIKYRWNNLIDQEKQYIRDNAMNLLASATNHLLHEQIYIKNAVSKIIVEIIKRQWPRDWPTLLSDLNKLCSAGDTQTELVLLVLLRLAEDTVTFQNISPQRRRELHQTLSQNVNDILKFFLELLRNHSSKILSLGTANDVVNEQILINYHMAESVLSALTAFVEWVSLPNLWAQEGILQTLCVLLRNERLQLHASECLLQIVSRKGKLDERLPVLALFNSDCMENIFHAAGTASSSNTKERMYIFLKRLCQVLVAVGNQLCALWGGLPNVREPDQFEVYLNAIFAFTCHPSPTLNSYTFPLWSAFFRHDEISQNHILQSFVCRLCQVMQVKLIKLPNQCSSDHPSYEFCALDFDCDEDFTLFFSKYRSEISDILRVASFASPLTTFQLAASWVNELIRKPIVTGCDSIICNSNSPSYREWDALTIFLESITKRILETDKPKPSIEDGICLLNSIVTFDVNDPLIFSCILSCISALFVFLTVSPDLFPVILGKIFFAVTFSLPGQTKATRSRAVKNVRRHACSSLIKMCLKYPNLLLPSFKEIYYRVKALSAETDQLSQMEKVTLLEALILISNQFNQYTEQANFINISLAPAKSIWSSQEMNCAFSGSEALMTFIGLNQAPVNPSDDDLLGINRSQIIYCVSVILGVLKRAKWPDDMDVARKGSFLREFPLGSQNAVLCNPATHSILPFMDNLFKLIRSVNDLWNPEIKQKVWPDYLRAYDMLDIEKYNVCGINPPNVESCEVPNVKTPVERMQLFLSNIYDTCYHVLGNLGPSLGHEFYGMPGLAQYVINHVIFYVDCIPDYKLRSIITFVQSCPPEYYDTVLIPILVQLCSYMFQRLNNRWVQFSIKNDSIVNDTDETSEAQEVLEDQVNRQLSREYIDLLAALILVKRGSAVDSTSDAMDEDEPSNVQQQNDNTQAVSDLGQHVLKNNIIRSAIVSCCFRALSWNDSTLCTKTLYLCSSLIKHLVSFHEVNFFDAKDLLISILMGLQQHGQHEANQSLLLSVGYQAYDSLRPLHPDLSSVLSQIPDCPTTVIKSLDEIILQTTPTKIVSDKKKKEMFKKIVFSIIGQNVGQLFKKPVHIKSLPPIFRPLKTQSSDIFDKRSADGALCRLFALTDQVDS